MRLHRWYLMISSAGSELVRLPLHPGHFSVAPKGGADFVLGAISGTLDVSETHVILTLTTGERFALSTAPQMVAGMLLHARINERAATGGTKSLPGAGAGDDEELILSFAKGPGEPLILRGAQLHVGTDASNDLVLRSAFASSFHCSIFRRQSQWYVRDLGSKNGTFLNEIKVVEAQLSPPATLRVGDVTLRLSTTKMQPAVDEQLSLIGASKAMAEVRSLIRKFAPTNAPVLIQGESGTGKELVARALHDTSSRGQAPFVAINCGALAESLIESELFGHVKGAFTGASERRLGAFVSAHGGTLFLDEIGELPLELQPKLLRVLETQQIKAIGEDKERAVDVRIIAATHRDLHKVVKHGDFREDLFHRLSVLTINLPPLRERPEDIIELAHHYVQMLSPEGRTLKLSSAAEKLLRGHPLPGNVRQLRNSIMRGLVMATSGVIEADHLGLDELSDSAVMLEGSLNDVEREAIVRALRDYRGSRVAVAKKLKIARSTLYRKIEQYRITDEETESD